ncbi:CehA/McbA family metallohydrolase [Maioricimonas rarisocia]|uniref:CehA/McbA family metallohydrolase n=1 Tax=Maioricimonas rarisocia TaxID=2528026 RepID=UPI0011A076E0|nr:CehA/McbA family metallohydrolase [Maioricimonas rarisocia]
MLTGPRTSLAGSRVLDADRHHLRIEGPREWSTFPETPDADRLEITFAANARSTEQSLRLYQEDVKQSWRVTLNGTELGRLTRDENRMVVWFPVPGGTLVDGENRLVIEQQTSRRSTPDDIRVGEIVLDDRPLSETLNESTIELTVHDGDDGKPLPARITIHDERGVLQTAGATSNDHLAVRAGTIYTSTGTARFGLPAGTYRIFAGRGFEYSLASQEFNVQPGESIERTLRIRREVPTEGYVACDTHVHTLTHSGHGDATVQERMITIAAEGIELPIATDHNVQIDHRPFARERGVDRYFTPVIGNEVTTKVGHFNIFPVPADAPVPDHTGENWPDILAEIQQATASPVVILNHARDLHSGVRPFGPARHLDVVGENLSGWPIDFNGMEVINSGATQTDPMQLLEDWMALLNRGWSVTPVGSSDSHDVARHFVGQGRTYIRCDDTTPGQIDVDAAVDSFRAGRVMVSYGLLAELTVDGRSSGETVTATGDEIDVDIRVLGPHWVQADRVELFMNGVKIRETAISAGDNSLPTGVKWQGRWTIPRPPHDVHLVAIAWGPGIDGSYWKTAKPYQPTSQDWQPRVFGCSGALWIDADGDGSRTSARTYAERIIEDVQGDLPALLERLADYDEAIVIQAAHLHRLAGGSPIDPRVQAAGERLRRGFRRYFEAWRETQQARSSAAAE